ncbi:MAG: helix-turn-helix transcriptional regulator [Planctomycetota bacterium]|jgi:predicted DNA-binding transcriptional regulator AlpA
MTISLERSAADPLLRQNEAAQYLGVSPAHLRLSRHTGELFKGCEAPRYVKLGHAVRYRKSTLDEWLSGLQEFHNTAEYHSAK